MSSSNRGQEGGREGDDTLGKVEDLKIQPGIAAVSHPTEEQDD